MGPAEAASLFLTKAEDWDYEEEERVVNLLDNEMLRVR